MHTCMAPPDCMHMGSVMCAVSKPQQCPPPHTQCVAYTTLGLNTACETGWTRPIACNHHPAVSHAIRVQALTAAQNALVEYSEAPAFVRFICSNRFGAKITDSEGALCLVDSQLATKLFQRILQRQPIDVQQPQLEHGALKSQNGAAAIDLPGAPGSSTMGRVSDGGTGDTLTPLRELLLPSGLTLQAERHEVMSMLAAILEQNQKAAEDLAKAHLERINSNKRPTVDIVMIGALRDKVKQRLCGSSGLCPCCSQSIPADADALLGQVVIEELKAAAKEYEEVLDVPTIALGELMAVKAKTAARGTGGYYYIMKPQATCEQAPQCMAWNMSKNAICNTKFPRYRFEVAPSADATTEEVSGFFFVCGNHQGPFDKFTDLRVLKRQSKTPNKKLDTWDVVKDTLHGDIPLSDRDRLGPVPSAHPAVSEASASSPAGASSSRAGGSATTPSKVSPPKAGPPLASPTSSASAGPPRAVPSSRNAPLPPLVSKGGRP